VLGAQVGFLVKVFCFLAGLREDLLTLGEEVIVVSLIGGSLGSGAHQDGADSDQQPQRTGGGDPDPGESMRSHPGPSRGLFGRPGGLLGGQAGIKDRTRAISNWHGPGKRHTNRRANGAAETGTASRPTIASSKQSKIMSQLVAASRAA